MADSNRKARRAEAARARKRGNSPRWAEVRSVQIPLWARRDLEWFDAHPERAFRVRGLYEGEFSPSAPKASPGYSTRVVVRLCGPGRIATELVGIDHSQDEGIFDDETTARALWEFAACASVAGERGAVDNTAFTRKVMVLSGAKGALQ